MRMSLWSKLFARRPAVGPPPDADRATRSGDSHSRARDPAPSVAPALGEPAAAKAKIEQILLAVSCRRQPPRFDDVVELLQGVGRRTNHSTAVQLGLGAVADRRRSIGDDGTGEVGLALISQVQGWLRQGAPPAESLTSDPAKYFAHVPSRSEIVVL